MLGRDSAPSANEQIIIGVIGIGGRCNQLIDQVPAGGQDRRRRRLLSAARDRRRQEAQSQLEAVYQDYRKMFDKEKLDAVIIATPDHARTLPCIRAVQAGLDVYAEKPLTAYIHEGRVLVNAVRKHNRIFQVGSQQRTMEINRFCCEFVRDGKIGKIKQVSAVNYTGPQTLPRPARRAGSADRRLEHLVRPDRTAAVQQPAAIRLDAMARLLRRRNDQLGRTRRRPNPMGTRQGRHRPDRALARWREGHRLDEVRRRHAGPLRARRRTDGRRGLHRHRMQNGNQPQPLRHEPGRLREERARPRRARRKWEGDGWIARPHIQNWLDCIKSRKLPNADVEIGHRSISVCHLVNITRELDRKLQWDPEKEQFVGDDEANKLLDRPRRAGFELPEV